MGSWNSGQFATVNRCVFHLVLLYFNPVALTVSLIFDLDFGSKLIELSKTTFVWACDSNRNMKAADEARALIGKDGPLGDDSVTTFEFDRKAPMLISFREIVATIDEHHEWNQLDVYGAKLSPTMKDSLLNEFGAETVQETEFGFTASR